MKDNLRRDFTFWLSIFAVAISAVTLILFFIKVTPNSVVDVSSFIGAIAAFIGISVTIVIGFQIYNSLDFKNKINELEELKRPLEELKQSLKVQKYQLETLKIEQEEGINIIQARLFHGNANMELDAFLRLHIAIKYSLSVDHKDDGYRWILDELEAYMLNITATSFSVILGCVSKVDYAREVNKFKDLYKDEDDEIRRHPNYLYIKERYEELMLKFEKRLDNIADLKHPSLKEVDKLSE